MNAARIETGDAAPAFSLPDQEGSAVTLDSLRGRWTVLYFYPKDNTPGCTKEACSFRDNHAAIAATGAAVLGVSPDGAASHKRFAEQHTLPFTLLADEDHALASAYGAWGIKKQYGREYEGLIRSTFVIDPEGNIAKVWRSVRTDRHGADVLAWLTRHAVG